MNNLYPKLILWILIGCSHRLYAQSPGGVSANLSLWVKAESATPTAGGTLTGWTDQVPTQKNTFTKSGSGISTVTNVINFHPVVRFTGAGTIVGNRSITWSECSAVAGWTGGINSERGTVISPTTSGTAPNDASRYYFRAGVESSPLLFAGMGVDSIGFEYIAAPPATAVNSTPPPVSILTASGVDNVFNQNGLDARIGSLYGGFTQRSTTMTGIPQIGDRSTNDSKMSGDIAEIIVYSSNNASNRNKVESYLALKYGLTLGNNSNTVNYTSSGNTVFWNSIATYQHNIFGIGTDQASGLIQSTSNSMNSGGGNGTGQNHRGNLVLTAGSTLSDQQFLMIGTDSAALTEQTMTAANGPAVAVGSKRLIRTWRVQNTHSVGAVTLSFDKTGLTLTGGNTASNYWLMIDNDGDGNFTTGTQTFVNASSLSTPLVSFTPVTLNNNIVFTIITFPSPMITLAISWESFSANAQYNTVNLQWTVSETPNADHYEIQRSSNAADFATTASVTTHNTTNTFNTTANTNQSYQFSQQLSPGVYYYRIRMVDKDGNDQFSTILSVSITGPAIALQIRSNPIQNNELQLQIDWPGQNTALIRISGRQGNILMQKKYALETGINASTIDVAALGRGLYYVQVLAGGQSHTLCFLK